MANIPVERTSGTPWWLWLLGLLLLLALIFFLIEAFDDDDDEVVVDDPIEDVDPVEDVDPIEGADPVVAAPVTETALDLSSVYVTRVTGDRTFFVAPSEAMADNETLVILDQSMSPGAEGIEGQVDINDGQTINLTGGRMEPLGDMSLAGMGLDDDEAGMMGPDTQVIRVDGGDVEVLDAPMGVGNVEVDE